MFLLQEVSEGNIEDVERGRFEQTNGVFIGALRSYFLIVGKYKGKHFIIA